MNIFERVQPKQGLENYCTHILVGILEKKENYELLEKFCFDKNILNIVEAKNDKSIEIKTQFHCFDAEKSFIDIIISSNNFLCFLEMKVESKQNKGKCSDDNTESKRTSKSQLEKYHIELQAIETKSQKKYLRYCTKYPENVTDIFNVLEDTNYSNCKYFEKLRWFEIHKFLKVEYQNNNLVSEFLDFLAINNMNNLEGKIHYEEKLSFHFFEMLSNLKKVLERVKRENAEFDYIGITGTPQLRLDDNHKRYGFSIPLGEKTKNNSPYSTNVFIGFDFGEIDKISQLIWFWSINYDDSKLKEWQFKTKTDNRKHGEEVAGLRVQKDLQKDIALQEIYDWFISELQNIETN